MLTSMERDEKYRRMLGVAIEEAMAGVAGGGVPVGAALFLEDGRLMGRDHNRRVQNGDPTAHGETETFRKVGRQSGYADKILANTLPPCRYCSELVKQFSIGTVVVGDTGNTTDGIDWLRQDGFRIVELNNSECIEIECIEMMRPFFDQNARLWNEDVGGSGDNAVGVAEQ